MLPVRPSLDGRPVGMDVDTYNEALDAFECSSDARHTVYTTDGGVLTLCGECLAATAEQTIEDQHPAEDPDAACEAPNHNGERT